MSEPGHAEMGMDRRPRRRLVLLLVPIVALSVAGTLADWFAAAIITEHPLLQIFLNPRIRYLSLAANHVDASSYYAVGFLRLVLTDPLFYLLGRWYGDIGIRWTERHMPGSEASLRATERLFARASYVLVTVAPNGLICLLAGATGMRPAVFVALDVAGTVARLVAIRLLADVFAGPLEAVLDFVEQWQWWLVGASVAYGLYALYRSRRGRRASSAGAEATEAGGRTAASGEPIGPEGGTGSG